MHETLLQKTVHLIVFLAVCGVIVFLGWDEPLSYRFMSRASIEALQESPTPPPSRNPREWNLTGTSLDRAPWDKKKDKIKYNPESVDSKRLGLPTETDRRGGTIGKQ